MSLDSAFLFAFLLTLVRCGAMLFASPFFGRQTPVQVRGAAAIVIALALTPVVAPLMGPLPEDLLGLVSAVVKEALIGLLIGVSLQLLILAAQMAGSFLDLEIGFGMAQVFDPINGTSSSLLAHFKTMLATVLLFLLNGHLMMFQAFVESYRLGQGLDMAHLGGLKDGFVDLIGTLSLISLQIAAPVAAVCVIVDVATGLINKAVPQMQAYLVSIPAKILIGVVALSLALPLMVVVVQSGVERTLDSVMRLIGNGGP